jgi:hypothetical protein
MCITNHECGIKLLPTKVDPQPRIYITPKDTSGVLFLAQTKANDVSKVSRKSIQYRNVAMLFFILSSFNKMQQEVQQDVLGRTTCCIAGTP